MWKLVIFCVCLFKIRIRKKETVGVGQQDTPHVLFTIPTIHFAMLLLLYNVVFHSTQIDYSIRVELNNNQEKL